jgi:hypothetical protein
MRVMTPLSSRLALGLVAVVAAIGSSAPVASAIEFQSLGATVSDLSGAPTRQAGAHPDVRFTFTIPQTDPSDLLSPVKEQPHQLLVDLPRGLIGNPTAAPTCSERLLKGGVNGNTALCPVGAQVGIAKIYTGGGPSATPAVSPIYNVVAPAGMPALFAFNVLGSVVQLTPTVRAGDFGITMDSGTMQTAVGLTGVDVVLWGVPADPAHDAQRYADITGHSGILTPPAKSQSPRLPFLTTPTSCPGTAEVTTARLDGWRSVGQFSAKTFSSDLDGLPFITTGCDRLAFAPSMDVRGTARTASAPTGLDVELKVPQSNSPDGLATAAARNVTVTLPKGMTVSASAAAGLGACQPSEIALDTTAAEQCPGSSKLGTVAIDTPLLAEPLTGAVYLAPQTPGHLVNLYLAASGYGVNIKLAGTADLDEATGQLTATFRDNPQLPFDALTIHFFGGPGAALSNPPSCGDHTTHATLTSWASDTAVVSDSSTPVDRSCDEGAKFEPSLSAGVANPKAGSSSPFTLTLSRPDGQQDISGLTVSLPPGVLGNVGSVPLCAEAQVAAGTCGAASQVGSTAALAGAGPSPLSVPQPGKSPTAAYLAGPYKGAPYSLSIVVPAQAGPFDLGVVVVRAALYIDTLDAHVTVKTDPLPTMLKGVPLDIQRIVQSIGRPGFMVSPTNCDPMAVSADVQSTAGATARVASRFQVGECGSLPLAPKLAMTLSGKGQTTDGKHPAVSATLTQTDGQANLKKVRVALPLSLALDPDNAESDGLCSFVEGSKPEPKCPASSVVGNAVAVTPVLHEPLTGPVYFVKNERKDPKSGRSIKTLPKIVIPLVGENGVKLTLTGTSDVVDDQLVTTFDNIPDAPVSSFKLNINGGKKGILVISGEKADICKSTQIADQQIDGQNGKQADADVTIQTPACSLKVLSKRVGKRGVAIKVAGLGVGKVTVTGKGIKKSSKTIAGATVATITAKRTKGKPAKVTVTFDPAGPAKARKTTR